jgi:hypothetical protein
MSCCDARPTLPLLLDEQLAAGERAAVLEKLVACGLCRAELAALAENDAALRTALAVQAEAVGARYFEDFGPRLAAKLEAVTLEGESMRTSSGSGSGDPSVASPAPAGLGNGKPTKEESSGLHDIKALAANAVRRSVERRAESEHGEDSDALLATPAALANVVLPQPGKQVAPPVVRATSVADANGVTAAGLSGHVVVKHSRAGLYVGVLGVLVAAGAVVLYMKKPNAAAPAPAPALAAADVKAEPAPAPAGEVKAEAAKPAEPVVAPVTAPEPEKTTPVAAPGDKAEKAEKAVASKDKDKAPAEAKPASEKAPEAKPAAPVTAAVSAPVAPPAAEAKPAAEKPHSEIDDIFGDKPATAPAKAAAPAGPALPEKLGPDDVKKGMATVKARVQACYDEFKVPGTIKVKVKIDADGTVSSADVVDEKFKATDTGACVTAAVKTAKFPAVSGAGLVVNYPFALQ